MTADDIAKAVISGLLLAFILVIGLAIRVIVRQARDPEVQREIGRGLRKSMDTAAKAAGKAAAALDTARRSASESFKAGRNVLESPPSSSDTPSRQGSISQDRFDQLIKLKSLLDSGAISEVEYQHEKRRILDTE